MQNKNRVEFIILGVIVAFGALLAENLFNVLFSTQADNTLNYLTLPLLAYILIEESLKLLVLKKKQTKETTGQLAFSNSFFLGVGFAITELFHRYLLNSSLPANDFAPLFGISIIHLATSVIIGYLLYKKIPWWLVILPPVFLHTLYNYFIIYEFDYFLIATYLLLLIILLFYVYLELKNESKTKFAK